MCIYIVTSLVCYQIDCDKFYLFQFFTMSIIAIKESKMVIAMNDLNPEVETLHLKQRRLIGMAPLITLPT